MNKKKMGRPAFYDSPEELQKAVDQYFNSCKGKPVFDENGAPVMLRAGVPKIVGERPPTMSGLSLALGYKDRRQFTQQKYRSDQFAEVVAVARLRVEMALEERLFNPNSYSGAAFMLRNCFGWGSDPAEAPHVGVKIVDAPAADTEQKQTGNPTAYHDVSIEILN